MTECKTQVFQKTEAAAVEHRHPRVTSVMHLPMEQALGTGTTQELRDSNALPTQHWL